MLMSLPRASSSLLALIALLGSTSPCAAQCAEWDPRFFGFDDDVHTLVSFDDGSGPALYAGGSFDTAGSTSAHGIAKWDGANWSSLGGDFAGYVSSLVVFDDGSGPALYAGGTFSTSGGTSGHRVARWNGTSWASLGGPGSVMNGGIYALAAFDDGSGPALYAGGNFTTAGGVSAPHLARWNGTGWSAVGGSGMSGNVHALGVYDDGSGPALYAGGSFPTAGGVAVGGIAKWDGASWSALGSGISGSGARVLAFEVFDDGSGPALYAGGTFTGIDGIPAGRIARWDGTSWSALGTLSLGTVGSVATLAVFDDGSGPALYAGGGFTTAGGVAVTNVARWDGASWSALGPAGGGTEGYVRELVPFDDGSGPSLYVGGAFTLAGGVSAPRIARWNGASWSPLGAVGGAVTDTVYSLAAFDDGSGPALYAAGGFYDAGGVRAPRVARWDGVTWSPLGASSLTSYLLLEALAPFDDGSGPSLYAGGTFEAIDGVPASDIARWDGVQWSPVGSGIGAGSVSVLAVCDDGSGAALYAGGSLLSAGGVSASRVARWDGSGWSPLGAPGDGVDNAARAIASLDLGNGPEVYVGGFFHLAGSVLTGGGFFVNNIARWDGTSWSPVGAPVNGVNGTVYALCAFDDGTGPALYVGGDFTTAGGVAAPHIARWDGTSWSALGAPGSGTDGGVSELQVFDDGSGPRLYVGGEFTTAGGVAAPHIARWDGTSWSALGAPGSGTDGTVLALAGFDDGADGDADLYLGGDFSAAGGLPSGHIAQWHGCPRAPLAHCFGDGGVAPCPCGNTGLAGRGCDNSSATGGALLTSTGTIAPDALVLTQQGELATALSIFLQGSQTLASPVVFGDGLRCAGGSLKRLYVQNAVGGTASAPGPGDPSITAQSALLGDPLAPGATREYQVYYRDPVLGFCPSPQGNSFNVGNALRVTW